MGMSNFLSAVLVCGLAFLIGCSHEKSHEPEMDGYRLDPQMPENPAEMEGQQIKFRGFLAPRLGSLAVYADEQAAANAVLGERPVIIRDTSPSRKLSAESTHYESKCTGMYAEIEGEVGFLDEFGFYGVTQILEIKTFADADFAGSGTLCYSSADMSLYSPREIEFE